MTAFLNAAAAVAVVAVGIGLLRILRGPSDLDRMMSAQLLGTGGIAAVLLAGAATGEPGADDLALLIALLAPSAAAAFAREVDEALPGEDR